MIGHCPLTSIHPYFIENKNNRQKFERTIRNCKTYQTFHKDGGKDSEDVKKRYVVKLIDALKFSEAINKEVFIKMVKDPLSLVVASHPDITLAQKR